MAFGGWFQRKPEEAPAEALYAKLVAQARRPEFYARCGVPDTVDGRFELIALHLFLLLHRLKRDHPDSADLAQAVFDLMFHDMDQSLREMGAGDLGVGRRVKVMIQGLYGRIAAYETGLGQPAQNQPAQNQPAQKQPDQGQPAQDQFGRGEAGTVLQDALRRNLYGTTDPAPVHLEALAAYMRRQVITLAEQGYTGLAAGNLVFGEVPTPETPPPGPHMSPAGHA